MNPSFAIPATIMIAPTIRAIIDASAIARSGLPSEPMIGRIVAAIIGPSDESGPEHQDPRRPEHGVADQAQDRGVQAGDRRQPGELGVRHPLRHEQRGQHHAGDHVAAQPRRLVARQRPDPGERARGHRRGRACA